MIFLCYYKECPAVHKFLSLILRPFQNNLKAILDGNVEPDPEVVLGNVNRLNSTVLLYKTYKSFSNIL